MSLQPNGRPPGMHLLPSHGERNKYKTGWNRRVYFDGVPRIGIAPASRASTMTSEKEPAYNDRLRCQRRRHRRRHNQQHKQENKPTLVGSTSSTQSAHNNSRKQRKQQISQQQQHRPQHRHAAKTRKRRDRSRRKQVHHTPVQTLEEIVCEGEEHSAVLLPPQRVSKPPTHHRQQRLPSPTRFNNDLAATQRHKFKSSLPPVREPKGRRQESRSLIVQPWDLNLAISHRYDLFCKKYLTIVKKPNPPPPREVPIRLLGGLPFAFQTAQKDGTSPFTLAMWVHECVPLRRHYVPITRTLQQIHSNTTSSILISAIVRRQSPIVRDLQRRATRWRLQAVVLYVDKIHRHVLRKSTRWRMLIVEE